MLTDFSYEDIISDNIKTNITKANKNKVFLENIYNSTFNIPSKQHHSIFIWNNISNIIYLDKKCNHIFLYNCKHITLHNVDCLTGITLLNCTYCNILFKKTPLYSIEISNSFNILLRSLLFSLPIIFKNCSITLYKEINYVPIEYVKIEDNNIFSQWHYKVFNF